MIKITQTTMTISEWGQVADNPILRKELAGGAIERITCVSKIDRQ